MKPSFGAFALLALLSLPAPAQAQSAHEAKAVPDVQGSCSTKETYFKVITGAFTTTGYEQMPGANFIIKKASKGCVIVTISAEVFTHDTLAISLFLDDNTASSPTYVYLTDSTNGAYTSHAFTFIFPSASKGKHSIKTYMESVGGGEVSVNYRSALIQY